MPKVSVVIVNFNTGLILRDCLLNLKDAYENMEIIVVDNGSTDDSVNIMKKEFSSVKLIESSNVGLAKGSNMGLKVASGDYILYLGTDAFPEKDTIKNMIAYLESHGDIGAATCTLILRDGSLDMDAHRGFPTPWTALTKFSKLNRIFPKSKLFNGYFMGWKDMNSPHEIDLCISHFMLVRKEVFDQVGGWDENFFVYGEDVDMCYRIKEAGWKIVYLPQWKALHYKGVSVGTRKESADITKASLETRVRMRSETVKAMKMFVDKHLKKRYPLPLIWLMYFAMFGLSNLRNFALRLKLYAGK